MPDIFFYRLITLYYARNHYRELKSRCAEDWDDSLAGFMLNKIERELDFQLNKIDIAEVLELL